MRRRHLLSLRYCESVTQESSVKEPDGESHMMEISNDLVNTLSADMKRDDLAELPPRTARMSLDNTGQELPDDVEQEQNKISIPYSNARTLQTVQTREALTSKSPRKMPSRQDSRRHMLRLPNDEHTEDLPSTSKTEILPSQGASHSHGRNDSFLSPARPFNITSMWPEKRAAAAPVMTCVATEVCEEVDVRVIDSELITDENHAPHEPTTASTQDERVASTSNDLESPMPSDGPIEDVIDLLSDDENCPSTQRAENYSPPLAPLSPPTATTTSSVVRCPTCGKNLTFLNALGQNQHVNNCLDQMELFERNKKQPKPSPSVQTTLTPATPPPQQPQAPILHPCTVCGIELCGKSTPQRVQHTKACARRFGVNVQSLRIDEEDAPAPDPSVEPPSVPQISNAFDMLMKNAQTASLSVGQPPRAGTGKKRKPSSMFNKPKDGYPCPQYKIIRGTTIVVDGFQYAKPSLSKVYFLSHFHSDHYTGLTKSFSAGIIYCTPVTAKLVLLCLGVDQKYIHPLPLNQPYVLPDQQAQVTFIDANHCPGAALILFQLRGGKTYLHTGDFRYDASMLESRFLLRFAHQEPVLDGVYLDTTYCEPQYCHPTQAVAIAEAKRLIDYHENDRALFLFGSYSIGKERLFMDVAHHLQRKVYVERSKLSLLSCFEWPESEMAMLTLEPSITNLHVVPMGSLNFEVMAALLSKHRLRFHKIIAFRPTGWTFSGKHKLSSMRSQSDGKLIIYGIPYSEHSSFEELCAFIKAFKPASIIPTVNCTKSQQQVDLLRQTSFHNITHHFK
ncbi:hypothetical protein LEN26_017602 [Aphanomyces euteiches]|nr:hypothetical protein LEN26_017602 [Aphanomyces euteiches]KAH9196969.1 hypothetical protein AeNC1_001048 [Aphanomyces euteiches]